jgi:hypothetical protein
LAELLFFFIRVFIRLKRDRKAKQVLRKLPSLTKLQKVSCVWIWQKKDIYFLPFDWPGGGTQKLIKIRASAWRISFGLKENKRKEKERKEQNESNLCRVLYSTMSCRAYWCSIWKTHRHRHATELIETTGGGRTEEKADTTKKPAWVFFFLPSFFPGHRHHQHRWLRGWLLYLRPPLLLLHDCIGIGDRPTPLQFFLSSLLAHLNRSRIICWHGG